MIRINLLPTKAARRRETFIQQIVVGAVLIILALLLCALELRQEKRELAAVEARAAKIKAEIERLQSVIAEVEQFKKDKAELQSKIDAIKKLQTQRSGPVKMMDELSTIIPPRLWLTSFRESSKSVKMEGAATDGVTIANFLEKLAQSKYFQDVRLIRVTQAMQKEFKILQFSIDCRIVYAV
jgi:type IV pilus assembly protein PilN